MTSVSPGLRQDHDQIRYTTAGLHSVTNGQNLLFQSHTSTEDATPVAQHGIQLQTSISPELSGHHNPHPLDYPTGPTQLQDIEMTHRSESIQPVLEQPANIRSLDIDTSADLEDAQSEDGLPESWYQNNFSSINWLPDNWTPDFPLDGNSQSFDQDRNSSFHQLPQASTITYSSALENAAGDPTLLQQVRRPRKLLRGLSKAIDGQENTSPSSQSSYGGGHYYVDGDGARLPRVRKAPYRYSEPYAHASMDVGEEISPNFQFSETVDFPDDSIADISQIPQSTYGEIVRIFNLTCTTSTHYSNFYGTVFPSRHMLSRCVLLYRDNFESILPFLHPATFDLSTSHWLLILAIAAVGSHYLDTGSEGFCIAMHEFLRRAIETVVSSPCPSSSTVSSNINCLLDRERKGSETFPATFHANQALKLFGDDLLWRREIIDNCEKLPQ
jgi:hypothetical protein